MIQSLPLGIVLGMIAYGITHREFSGWKLVMCILLSTYVVGITKITGVVSETWSIERFVESIKSLSVPFQNASYGMLLLNFLLFVPMGIFLPYICQNRIKHEYVFTCLLCSTFSLAIELLQGMGGRFMELDDLIMNSAGALAGVLAYHILKKSKLSLPSVNATLLVVLFACVLFLSMKTYDSLHQAKQENVTMGYMHIYDTYDDGDSTIRVLYDQVDSLERLHEFDEELENKYEKQLELYTVQSLKSAEDELDIQVIAISQNLYEKLEVYDSLVQGEEMKNFDYTDGICPVYLPSAYVSEYELYEEVELLFLGDVRLHCRIIGFLDEQSALQIGDYAYSYMNYAVMPLFENVYESSLDELTKQILLTERIESVISYGSSREKREIKQFINSLSEKYDLQMVLLDSSNNIEIITVPTWIWAVLLAIGLYIFLQKTYRYLLLAPAAQIKVMMWNLLAYLVMTAVFMFFLCMGTTLNKKYAEIVAMELILVSSIIIMGTVLRRRKEAKKCLD